MKTSLTPAVQTQLRELAVQSILNCDDTPFWELAQPLLDSNGYEADGAELRAAWDHATQLEGYNNTLALLGCPPISEPDAGQVTGDNT